MSLNYPVAEELRKLVQDPNQCLQVSDNLFVLREKISDELVKQVQDVYSKKWGSYRKEDIEALARRERARFLKLYGFNTEEALKGFLENAGRILDAGCGLGYKAAWFAELSPNSIVFAMDLSESVYEASKRYKHLRNLIFIHGDISFPFFKEGTFDLVVCDQVLPCVKDPAQTVKELSRVLKPNGYLLTYVYAQKSIPRELIDEYFRTASKDLSHEELFELSEQVTQLGKILSDLKVTIEVPDIPLLRIKGGKWDLQRFIYYNFLKCFWNEELGWHGSVLVNYDWYAPAYTYRHSEEEFKKMLQEAGLDIEFFYQDEMAAYTARTRKTA
jgi:ubiquinone/menaquinone biosynthesis C-methylase UbiE